ncbi:MAG TPA: hypothetical protein VHF25_11855, partial [Nitriliruptorales bacterium]|nr:hypothetical protein [Nitriliruptorales bacterium]
MAVMDREERRRLYRDTDAGTVMLAEFLAAPLVWGGIGWAVDTYLLHSFPWGLVVGLLVGYTVGMYLMYVRMQAQGRVE